MTLARHEPVVLYAEFTARDGQVPDVERLIRDLAADVRREPGNAEFSVYRDRAAPRRFVVFERYVDRAAFDDHLSAPYGIAFNAALGPLIEEDGSQLTFLDGVDATTEA